jgi:hypothetical protein
MDDVIALGERELWEYETYGSFWNGAEVMGRLMAELLAARKQLDEAYVQGYRSGAS